MGWDQNQNQQPGQGKKDPQKQGQKPQKQGDLGQRGTQTGGMGGGAFDKNKGTGTDTNK